METLIPLGDRIVVEPFAAKEVTDGGLALPESARVPPLRGKVVACGAKLHQKVEIIGPGKDDWIIPETINPGDTVLYTAFAGTETEVGGKTYLVMGAGDVLGIIRDV